MIELEVYFKDKLCGWLARISEREYSFVYEPKYLVLPEARQISVNLPLRPEPYVSETLHPFFDNLISEGWLLEAQIAALKIDKNDRFALIANCGIECMGAVSLRGAK